MLKDMITFLLQSGLTQKEIGEKTGVPQPAISRIVNGDQREVGYAAGKCVERLYQSVNRQQKRRAA